MRGMGSAFHQLCPRYSGTQTLTAPTVIRLWDTFTFTFYSFRQFTFAYADLDNLIADLDIGLTAYSNENFIQMIQ